MIKITTNQYDNYIYFTFLIKILFVLCSMIKVYYKFENRRLLKKGQKKTKKYKTNQKMIFYAEYAKQHFEFIFIILMSFLILYLFNPLKKTIPNITYHTKVLLVVFASILIVNANWYLFFKEPSYFVEFQEIVGKTPNQ